MMKIQETAVRAGSTAIVSRAFSHHPEHPQGDPGARFRRRAGMRIPSAPVEKTAEHCGHHAGRIALSDPVVYRNGAFLSGLRAGVPGIPDRNTSGGQSGAPEPHSILRRRGDRGGVCVAALRQACARRDSLAAPERTIFTRYATPPQTTISQDYGVQARAVVDVLNTASTAGNFRKHGGSVSPD